MDYLSLSFLRPRKTRRRVAIVSASVAVIAALGSFLLPNWYRSVVTVVPTKTQKSGGVSAMLGGDLAGLAGGLADGALGGGADIQRIVAVLHSNDVSDAVIAKFDLKKRYAEKYQEDVREALWTHCDVKALPKPGLVQLSCEDKDPRFAQDLLRYFADYGNQVFRRIGVSTASEQVRFLEKRTVELRAQADETAQRIREFQEQHRIIDLESQAKAVVNAMAALNTQRITKQLQLDYTRGYAASDEASLKQLESQIGVVEKRLRSLESEPKSPDKAQSAPDSKRDANGLFPVALVVPRLRAEYERLFRDRKVAEATLVFALQQLESAKADEARDTSTFLILDPPSLPTRKSRPHRAVTIVLLACLGFLAAVGYEWWRAQGSAALRTLLATEPSEVRSAPSGESRSA